MPPFFFYFAATVTEAAGACALGVRRQAIRERRILNDCGKRRATTPRVSEYLREKKGGSGRMCFYFLFGWSSFLDRPDSERAGFNEKFNEPQEMRKA